MACFIVGFIGIQAISRLIHQFIPDHVVDCDHTHDENAVKDANSCQHGRRQSRASRARRRLSQTASRPSTAKSISELQNGNGHSIPSETTPLLDSETNARSSLPQRHDSTAHPMHAHRNRAPTARSAPLDRRPSSILQVQKRVMSFVQDTKCGCDESGSCYGYSDPCGQECFKHINKRSAAAPRQQLALRTTTGALDPPLNTSMKITTNVPKTTPTTLMATTTATPRIRS